MTAELQEELTEFFEGLAEIKTAYLFGSQASEDAGPTSDIDVAIVFDSEQIEPGLPQSRRRLELTVDLGQQFPGQEIDLLLLDKAPPLLAHRVIRDGVLLKETDREERFRREERIIHRYIDTKPLRKAQWKLQKKTQGA